MKASLRVWLALVLFVSLSLAASVTGTVSRADLVVPKAGTTQIITLDDGSTLVGKITEVGDTQIKFQGTLGEMSIDISRIQKIDTVAESSIKDGKYWYPNPNQTRMLFGPTGRMLKKGKGYFADVLIFFPAVAYGLTDNITIGGGMSIFPGLDADRQLYFLTPKVGLNVIKNVDVAANLMLIRVPVDDEDIEAANDLLPPDQQKDAEIARTVGVMYVSGTYGSENSYATFGLGFGMVDEEFGDKPALIFGLEHRFARRVSFVSENWVLPGLDNPLVSGGLRFIGENIAVDLAAMTIFDEDVPFIPYIGFVYNF